MSVASPVNGVVARSRGECSSFLERPYFMSGIGVILSLGAVWGAIILLRMALGGSFTSVGLHEVNAHGHAQVFGWVGLFVMGFGYRVLPALSGRSLHCPGAAELSWGAMLVGLTLRAGLQPFVPAYPGLLMLAHVGSVLEILAIAVFTVQVLKLLRVVPIDISVGAAWLVRAGVLCFALQAVASAIYFHTTVTASDREELLWLVSNFQPVLRDLQVHGFAMLMALGVGMMLLPRWMATRPLSGRGAKRAAVVLIAAVALEIAGFLLMRFAGHRWAAVWGIAALMMLGASAWIVIKSRYLTTSHARSRSSKFVRAGHAWLLISLTMLVLLPVWQFLVLPALAPESHAVEIGFSHAYYGAIRHAITVGFLSLMILGMSSRLMERLYPADALPEGNLLPAFILVNTGCFMRVLFQAATDIQPGAFPLAGVSGILEVTGIALWGVWMIRALYGAKERRFGADECLLTPETN